MNVGNVGIMENSEGFVWQTKLTLRFVCLDIPGVMGQWQLTTGGVKSSIPDIIKTFDTVLNRAGTIRGLPFDLIVQKVGGKSLGLDGGVQSTSFPVVQLIPNFTEDNVLAVKNFLENGGDPNRVALLTMNINKIESETKKLEDGNTKRLNGKAELGEGKTEQEGDTAADQSS